MLTRPGASQLRSQLPGRIQGDADRVSCPGLHTACEFDAGNGSRDMRPHLLPSTTSPRVSGLCLSLSPLGRQNGWS